MAKKYYWLKLMNDFFQQPKMKKLRKIAGGDTYTIIYLKLQLLSLKTGGKLYFDGVEDTFAEELALTIDEDEDNVLFTLMFLKKQGLIEQADEHEYSLIETMKNIGSESASTERVRRFRERQKEAAILENKGLSALPDGGKALQCNTDETKCNTDIDKEIDIEIDIEREKRGNDAGGEPPATPRTRKNAARFIPPTLEEVRAYCKERRNNIDADRFFAYYESTGWYRGKTKIKDWRACVRTWEQKELDEPQYPARARNERSRVKSEAEHARGGSADGFGW